jgi:hypothetical protein
MQRTNLVGAEPGIGLLGYFAGRVLETTFGSLLHWQIQQRT